MIQRSILMWSAAAAALVGGLAPQAAMAQASAAATAAGEDIVVTARKREETVQDVPVAVSVFSQEQIESLQIQSIDDVARFTPGLSFSKTFGRSTDRPVVRGQSNVLANVQFGVESGTAYFIDGVYYPGSIQSLDLGDVARVEVIKGPQSALYGRNTYAGAINFITRNPGEEFGASGSVLIAQANEVDVRAALEWPLGDNAGVRISLRRYTYDGEYTNRVTNELVGGEETTSAAIAFRWDMTPDLSLRIRTMYNADADGPLPLFLQPATSNNCMPGYRSLLYRTGSGSTNNFQYFCGVIQPGQVALNTSPAVGPVPVVPGAPATLGSNVYSTRDGTAFDGIERDTWLTTANLNWDIGGSGYELGVNFGFRDESEKFGTDSDHSSVNFFFTPPSVPTTAEGFFANTSRDDIQDYSLETILQSPTDGSFRWKVGAYFYYGQNTGYDITFLDPEGVNLRSDLSITRNHAYFGLAELDLTPQLTLTAEARYAEEVKSVRNWNTTAPFARTFYGSARFDSFTPRVTLRYQPTDDITLYGIYSQGAKPGGLNGSIGVASGRPSYEQEESTNYEVGAKFNLFDGRLTLNSAAYYIEASDVQLTTAAAGVNGAITSIATNQGQGEILGLELDGRAILSDYLSIGASYAWTRPEFTSGCDSDQWMLTSGGGILAANQTAPGTGTSFFGLTGNCSIAGKRYPLTSEHQASFDFDLRPWTFDNGAQVFVQGNVSYESSKYVQVHNLAETGDTTLVGGRLGIEGDHWTFAAFGRNLTDEDTITLATRWLQMPYVAGAGPSTAPTTADRGAPRAFFGGLRPGRTLGLELRFNY
ncbi:MAG: TonB-dependent receptor [Caulobacterales bacterium]